MLPKSGAIITRVRNSVTLRQGQSIYRVRMEWVVHTFSFLFLQDTHAPWVVVTGSAAGAETGIAMDCIINPIHSADARNAEASPGANWSIMALQGDEYEITGLQWFIRSL